MNNNIIEGLEYMVKRGWFNRLCDNTDNSVSASTVFLIVVTIIGCILLLIPAFILIIEVWYNHTISTDLTGLAAYITAVVSLFATGGLTKAWSTWSVNKYNTTSTDNTVTDNNSTQFTELKE